MEQVLAQIGILGAGMAVGNVLIKLVTAAACKIISAIDRRGESNHYNPQPYYQPMPGPAYNYYQTNKYY
ncbi:unnamed protein product [Adineta steineri]|uniref:Uncharacterized protein n=1 Tax=Adineta steineri TaxID=433720 RepID=A0A813VM11_9BILA|nr:unnamed protein product [Adineta steineri]CAF0854225.1 unnamed protein product [Adineta steineri]CAF0867221.1 unnamed protein product [Adineta steineri]CAF3885513.1 unnamed protein product [Adineta steineri]CAF3922321.1 unnamed protein product [Adineta steineri]